MLLPHFSNEDVLKMRPKNQRPAPGDRPLDFAWETEAFYQSPGAVAAADVLTVFLLGSECKFRCVMCDLWKYTHEEPTRSGMIPKQIDYALRQSSVPLRSRPWIKLYNASNFFAPANVPLQDLPIISKQLTDFDRVIVENHPRLVGAPVFEFAKALSGRLEVAMGLETVHPQLLASLNKSMTTEDFSRAARRLVKSDIDVRAFVLLRPPGMPEAEAVDWCSRSIHFARECGVRHVSIIPVRAGNGAIEHLQKTGYFEPPSALLLEQVLMENMGNSSTIITADLWDWEKLVGCCPKCSVPRRQRLQDMNLQQQASAPPPVGCACLSS